MRLTRSGPIFLALLSLSVVRADTVKLTNGREVKGTIEEETRDRVVVKTAAGRMTFPRALVASVQHESAAVTKLGEARALAGGLDPRAVEAFEKAAALAKEAGDTATEEAAKKELEAFRGRAARGPPRAPDGPAPNSGPVESDPEIDLLEKAFAEGDANAGVQAALKLVKRAEKLHADERCAMAAADYARAARDAPESRADLSSGEVRCRCEACGQALLAGDSRAALAAIEPAVALKAGRRQHVLYLRGRALEASGREDAALASYKEAVGSLTIASPSLDLLRFLARRAAAGMDVGPSTVGVGAQWKRAAGDRFCLFHDFEDQPPTTEIDQCRAHALERLGVADAPGALPPTPVFVFSTKADYAVSGGYSWSGGHTEPIQLEDGPAAAVYTFVEGGHLGETLEHEFAHVLVGAYLRGKRIPGWASEGAATYAEPPRARRQRARLAMKLAAANRLEPSEKFLARVRPGYEGDVSAFYTQSYVTFDALVARAGSASRVIDASMKVARDGVGSVVRELGFTGPEDLDQMILSRMKGDPDQDR